MGALSRGYRVTRPDDGGLPYGLGVDGAVYPLEGQPPVATVGTRFRRYEDTPTTFGYVSPATSSPSLDIADGGSVSMVILGVVEGGQADASSATGDVLDGGTA